MFQRPSLLDSKCFRETFEVIRDTYTYTRTFMIYLHEIHI